MKPVDYLDSKLLSEDLLVLEQEDSFAVTVHEETTEKLVQNPVMIHPTIHIESNTTETQSKILDDVLSHGTGVNTETDRKDGTKDKTAEHVSTITVPLFIDLTSPKIDVENKQ